MMVDIVSTVVIPAREKREVITALASWFCLAHHHCLDSTALWGHVIDTPFNFLTQALKSGVNHEGPVTHNTEGCKSSLLRMATEQCKEHFYVTALGTATEVKAGLWSSLTSQSQGHHCTFSCPGESLNNHHFPSQPLLKLYFLRTYISLYASVIMPWLSKSNLA